VPDIWLIIWLIAGVALVVTEVFLTTFVLLMFGMGAFAAAGVAALGVGPVGQGVTFAAVSALSLALVRPLIRKYVHNRARDTPMGLDAIEGSTGLVLETVDTGNGLIKLEGELWRARPYDATQVIQAGEHVRVIEIKGATAMVWKD
jgi:membrane protein implicated in regulation of membrane protease activity